jgi:hypothetical protein
MLYEHRYCFWPRSNYFISTMLQACVFMLLWHYFKVCVVCFYIQDQLCGLPYFCTLFRASIDWRGPTTNHCFQFGQSSCVQLVQNRVYDNYLKIWYCAPSCLLYRVDLSQYLNLPVVGSIRCFFVYTGYSWKFWFDCFAWSVVFKILACK